MIREFDRKDIKDYKKMCKEFYSSDAVLKNIPEKNIDAFIEEVLSSDVYAKCYIMEYEGDIAGYAVTAKTYSQEAGGIVLWVEEAFLKKEFRGRGLGKEFFDYILKTPNVKRFRLEVEDYNVRAKKLYSSLDFEMLEYEQMYLER